MRFALACAWLLVAACADGADPARAPRASEAEPNVRPDINANYRSPTLDAAQWAANFSNETREAYAARDAVVRAMQLAPGERVADVGAGTGIYVPLFSRAVGPKGKVYAVDIAPRFLEWIRAQAEKAGLRNVVTVLGEDRTANLPEAAVDVVFHSDTYHHFEYPRALTRDLARALVPGGEMYVLDFERIEGVSSEFILGHVRAGKETVIEEIESAGFTLVREIELPELKENYLLHFRKD